jgi:molybdopterin-binding protein
MVMNNARVAFAGQRVARHAATIGYTLGMKLSARNHLVGKVVELQLGDVMAHVVVKVGDNLVESVITRRSAEEMALKVGDTVAAVIKSTEVMLQKS